VSVRGPEVSRQPQCRFTPCQFDGFLHQSLEVVIAIRSVQVAMEKICPPEEPARNALVETRSMKCYYREGVGRPLAIALPLPTSLLFASGTAAVSFQIL
jgi:hypothetical protein